MKSVLEKQKLQGVMALEFSFAGEGKINSEILTSRFFP